MQPSATRPVAEDAAQALSQQLPCLARLAAEGGEGLVVVDQHSRCAFVNDLAARLCGAAATEFSNLSVSTYLARLLKHCRLADAGWPDPAGVPDLAALLARRPLCFTCSPGAKGLLGQERQYTLTPYPLRDDAGALAGCALFIRDMTPLLHEGPLGNGLLSSVSHDLRTPLTAIKAAVTGLLQEELAWDEALRRETLEDINEETDRLTTLVSALLEMSRIQGGALRLQTEWCDLAEIIYTVLDRLQKLTRDHRVVCDLGCPLPLVQADFMQLDRVLSNLVENAVKYSPVGTEIRIAAETHEAEIRISVVDQGIGVPEEEREQIFEKFYRVRQHRVCPSRAGAGKQEGQEQMPEQQVPSSASGSGLGLAICRGVVLAHHGRIWVEPGTEAGSRFVFTLPIEQTLSMSGKGVLEHGAYAEPAVGRSVQERGVLGNMAPEDAGEESKETDGDD